MLLIVMTANAHAMQPRIHNLYQRIERLKYRIQNISNRVIAGPLCKEMKSIWMELLFIQKDLRAIEYDTIQLDNKISKSDEVSYD